MSFYREQDAKNGGTSNQWSDAANFLMANDALVQVDAGNNEVDIVPSSSGVLSQSDLAS